MKLGATKSQIRLAVWAGPELAALCACWFAYASDNDYDDDDDDDDDNNDGGDGDDNADDDDDDDDDVDDDVDDDDDDDLVVDKRALIEELFLSVPLNKRNLGSVIKTDVECVSLLRRRGLRYVSPPGYEALRTSANCQEYFNTHLS